MSAELPVTGAWRPGDPPGHRRFLTFPHERPFALDTGTTLLACAVLARPADGEALPPLPDVPDVATLRERFRTEGRPVLV